MSMTCFEWYPIQMLHSDSYLNYSYNINAQQDIYEYGKNIEPKYFRHSTV